MKLDRRQILIGGAALLAAPALIGKAAAQGQTVRMLSRSHFVPEYEAWLKETAAKFEAETGIQVISDHIAQAELAVRYVSEVSSRQGHDVVELIDPFTLLPVYADQLADVGDVAEDLGSRNGGWLPVAENYTKVGDSWKGILNYYIDHSACYRKDLFDQIGAAVPQTWQEVLEAGIKLKEIGHPVGMSFARGADSTANFNTLLWAFDAGWVSPDGADVTIVSPETKAALEFAKELYERAMTPEVLAWDDSGNNRFMISGRGSWTLNAPSVYKTAMAQAPDIGQHIFHTLPPAGPNGTRVNYSMVYGYGIWEFSPNIEASKRWLTYLVDNWMSSYPAVVGYNYPGLRGHAEQIGPVLSQDSHIADLVGIPEIAQPNGYPGPITKLAAEVAAGYVLPDMFLRMIRSGDADEAMAWAESQILEIQSRQAS